MQLDTTLSICSWPWPTFWTSKCKRPRHIMPPWHKKCIGINYYKSTQPRFAVFVCLKKYEWFHFFSISMTWDRNIPASWSRQFHKGSSPQGWIEIVEEDDVDGGGFNGLVMLGTWRHRKAPWEHLFGFRRWRFFLQAIHWWLWCWWVLMICMVLYMSPFLVSIMSYHVTESRIRRDTSQFQAMWRCWGIQWLKRSKYGTMAKDPLGAFGWRMNAILRSWRYSSTAWLWQSWKSTCAWSAWAVSTISMVVSSLRWGVVQPAQVR